ncbi:hypothetical protein BJX64DRAFT_263828 [Aspergillus heterothallicus]
MPFVLPGASKTRNESCAPRSLPGLRRSTHMNLLWQNHLVHKAMPGNHFRVTAAGLPVVAVVVVYICSPSAHGWLAGTT